MGDSSDTFIHRWGLIIFAGILLAIVAGFLLWHFGLFSSGDGAQRIDDLQAAYRAVLAIQMATLTGVSYLNYGPMVSAAITELAIYEPADDEADDIKKNLSFAATSYAAAKLAWSTKFEDYPNTAWRNFKSANPVLRLSSGVDVDEGIRILWGYADAAMEMAKEGLDNYKGH